MRSSEARVSAQEAQSGLRDPSVYVAGTTEEEQGWSVFSGSSRGLPRASSRRVRSKEASPVRTVGEIRSGLPDLGGARRDTSGESDRGTVQSAEAALSGERGLLGKNLPKPFGGAPQGVKAPKSTGETDSLRVATGESSTAVAGRVKVRAPRSISPAARLPGPPMFPPSGLPSQVTRVSPAIEARPAFDGNQGEGSETTVPAASVRTIPRRRPSLPPC